MSHPSQPRGGEVGGRELADLRKAWLGSPGSGRGNVQRRSTTRDRTERASELGDIRTELAALQERCYEVTREVRLIPGGEQVYRVVDAYPGLRLDRDMGAGRDADGWLERVAEFLVDEHVP